MTLDRAWAVQNPQHAWEGTVGGLLDAGAVVGLIAAALGQHSRDGLGAHIDLQEPAILEDALGVVADDAGGQVGADQMRLAARAGVAPPAERFGLHGHLPVSGAAALQRQVGLGHRQAVLQEARRGMVDAPGAPSDGVERAGAGRRELPDARRRAGFEPADAALQRADQTIALQTSQDATRGAGRGLLAGVVGEDEGLELMGRQKAMLHQVGQHEAVALGQRRGDLSQLASADPLPGWYGARGSGTRRGIRPP